MIGHCPSAEHRAVLRLLGVALGADPCEDLLRDLKKCDPVRLAGIANVNHVHTVLASALERHGSLKDALPEDLWLYFQEMQRANIERQERGRRQLKEIGELFCRNEIEGVVLKGGAELLDPLCASPGHRFVSDLDILVRKEDAAKVQDLFRSVGGEWEEYTPWTARQAHHLPPISFSDWEYPVEVHFRVGSDLISEILPPDEVFARSSVDSATGLAIPSRGDRFLHHIMHTMQGQFVAKTLYVRGIADHHAFCGALESEKRQSVIRDQGSEDLSFRSAALDAQLWVTVSEDVNEPGIRAANWLKTALRRFGQPERQKWRETVKWAVIYLGRFLRHSDYRRHYLHTACSLEGWRQFWDSHRMRASRTK